ncbi:MAG: hypothetical protein ABEJ74_05665 [Haloferacaceae archaeon]
MATSSNPALSNLKSLLIAKVVIVLVGLSMVGFMLGNAKLYPPWTVVMIGAVTVFTGLSVFRDFKG